MDTADILRQKNIKATWQRIAVYEMLKQKGHSTAENIHTSLREKIPTLSLATVYAILNLFCRKGIIGEVGVYNNRAYFDITTGFHYHFVCTRCGKIADVNVALCRALKERRVGGNVIEKFSGIFFGVCRECLGRKI